MKQAFMQTSFLAKHEKTQCPQKEVAPINAQNVQDIVRIKY